MKETKHYEKRPQSLFGKEIKITVQSFSFHTYLESANDLIFDFLGSLV